MADNPITEIDEMIKNGDIDITTIEAVENKADKRRREKEPDAYALTYDEAVTILRANNIFEAVALRNGYITIDDTTGSRVYNMDDTVSKLTITAFKDHGIDADELKTLIDRVYDGDFFSIMLTNSYEPEPGKMGFSMLSQINGVKQSGILKIEDYPTIYTSTSRTEEREALGLPTSAKYLYSAEFSIILLLRNIFYADVDTVMTGTLAAYDMMPNNVSINMLSRIMDDRPIRPKPRGEVAPVYKAGENEHQVIIITETNNTITTYTINNYELFYDSLTTKNRRGNMGGVKKVWRYALQQLMKQCYHSKLPEYVIIDLQDMINKKMYSTMDTAYRAIGNMVKKISQVFIEEESKNRRRTQQTDGHGGVVFYDYSKDGNTANIYVNRQFNYEFFKSQYTRFPSWAYSLDDAAFTLAEYIFSMMRQRAQEIQEKGKFKIMLDMLHIQLALKDVEEVRERHNRRYADFIKSPIIKAVKQVNEAAKADKEIDGKIRINLKAPTNGNIETWLKTGYIEVIPSGEYTDYLTSIAEGRQLYTTTHRETLKAEKIKKAATRRARSEANEEAPRRGRKPKQRS